VATWPAVGQATALKGGRWAVRVLALVGFTAVIAFFASAGTFRFDRGWLYYDELGAAFLRGQLYLAEQPRPELLALPNPYDATQNGGLTLHDASLYGGHYYLYFGPTPALIHAAWWAVRRAPLDDGVVQVAAVVVATVAVWGLLSRARCGYAPATPTWIVAGCTLTFGLGGVMLYLVGRPAVYHEAILVAIAAMAAAAYALFRALDIARHAWLWLALSGSLVGLALASRITYLAYAVSFALVLVWISSHTWRPLPRRLALLAAFGAPIVCTGLLLGWYNSARFGSAFDFGTTYALGGSNVGTSLNCGESIGTYAAVYLGAVPKMDPFFPFFWYAAWDGWGEIFPPKEWVPFAGPMPREMPLISPFVLQPVALVSLVAIPLVVTRKISISRVALSVALALLIGGLLTIPLLGCVYGINLRYFGDLAPGLAIAGSIFLITAYQSAARKLVSSFAVVAWSSSLAIGVALGIGVWTFAYPEQVIRPRRIANELAAGITAYIHPDTVRDWLEPADGTSWREHDGRYLDRSTIFMRTPQTDTALVIAVNLLASEPANMVIRIDASDVDQQVLTPGRQLIVTRDLPELRPDSTVGVRLTVPSLAQAQAGATLPLIVYRVFFTRGPAETAAYRTIATGIAQAPSTAEELLATSDELRVRQALLDNIAALRAADARIIALEAEINQLRNQNADPNTTPGGGE
jgi:hypothetical protein